jgi:hypothetical protein
MQKVEGSSPFSRFEKGPQNGPFSLVGPGLDADVSRNHLPNADVQLPQRPVWAC